VTARQIPTLTCAQADVNAAVMENNNAISPSTMLLRQALESRCVLRVAGKLLQGTSQGTNETSSSRRSERVKRFGRLIRNIGLNSASAINVAIMRSGWQVSGRGLYRSSGMRAVCNDGHRPMREALFASIGSQAIPGFAKVLPEGGTSTGCARPAHNASYKVF
jgi:hypothetical protein